MPKQEFETIDFVAPVIVAAVFAVIVFTISFVVINFCCILKVDDATVFEKMNKRLGRRTQHLVAKKDDVDAEYQMVGDGKKLIN